MPNSGTTVGIAKETMPSSLSDYNKAIGPKEVKTPNMTVVMHDIDKVAKVMERQQRVVPSLCTLSGCRSRPNREAYQLFPPEDSCGCGTRNS